MEGKLKFKYMRNNNLLSSIMFVIVLMAGFICSFCAIQAGISEWWPYIVFGVLNIPTCGFAAFALFERYRNNNKNK